MRASNRIPLPLWFLKACVLLLSLCFGFQEEYQQRKDIHPVMFELSKAIVGIQKALSKGDSEALLMHAEAMGEASGEMSAVEPQINRGMVQVFSEHREAIGRLASELVSRSKANDLTEVPQIVHEIRHNCVSCHVKFRANRNEYDLFPNTGNVVTGEITIVKLDGEERTDRSNVVVFIDRIKSDSSFSIPRKNPVISQKNRRFEPRVVPIVKGTTVEFPNDDAIFHNVFSLSKTKPFDLDIYPPGKSKSTTFNQTGWVKVYCNIHPQMVSHIIVLDNPYFALTDEQGLFVISGVPDGEYTLRVWPEFGSDVREEIQLFDSILYRTSFKVQENKKFVQHRNKFGKPYKRKY